MLGTPHLGGLLYRRAEKWGLAEEGSERGEIAGCSCG